MREKTEQRAANANAPSEPDSEGVEDEEPSSYPRQTSESEGPEVDITSDPPEPDTDMDIATDEQDEETQLPTASTHFPTLADWPSQSQ